MITVGDKIQITRSGRISEVTAKKIETWRKQGDKLRRSGTRTPRYVHRQIFWHWLLENGYTDCVADGDIVNPDGGVLTQTDWIIL